MKRIAVLTSGGDGPGLNPCIRAVVRRGLRAGVEVFGVRWGYAGLIDNDMTSLDSRDVSGILGKGGTFLGTARCPEFLDINVRRTAIRHLNQRGIEGLIVIGGNGSLTGAQALHEMGFPTMGVPGSIDNDIDGTDMAVGVDTTLNTILDAIDRIKDTASSHQRAFLVEVMGRHCGYVALMAGIAGGAEVVVIPEREIPPEDVALQLREARDRGKTHALVVVAEGAQNNAQALVQHFQEHPESTGFTLRATILGHVQRGASPTAADRLLATRLGEGAVRALLRGETGVLTGLSGNKVVTTPLSEVVGRTKGIDLRLFELAGIMAR